MTLTKKPPRWLPALLFLASVAAYAQPASWSATRPVRLIGVGTPLDSGERQWTLEEDPASAEKRERFERLKDQLREKFGEGVIRAAARGSADGAR